MANSIAWSILEPDLESIFRRHASPLDALAGGEIPANAAAILFRMRRQPEGFCRGAVEARNHVQRFALSLIDKRAFIQSKSTGP